MLRRCAHRVALTRQPLNASCFHLQPCTRSSSSSAAPAMPGDAAGTAVPRARDGTHHAQPQQLSQRLARVVRLIGAIEGRLDGAPELGLGLELDSAITPRSPTPQLQRVAERELRLHADECVAIGGDAGMAGAAAALAAARRLMAAAGGSTRPDTHAALLRTCATLAAPSFTSSAAENGHGVGETGSNAVRRQHNHTRNARDASNPQMERARLQSLRGLLAMHALGHHALRRSHFLEGSRFPPWNAKHRKRVEQRVRSRRRRRRGASANGEGVSSAVAAAVNAEAGADSNGNGDTGCTPVSVVPRSRGLGLMHAIGNGSTGKHSSSSSSSSNAGADFLYGCILQQSVADGAGASGVGRSAQQLQQGEKEALATAVRDANKKFGAWLSPTPTSELQLLLSLVFAATHNDMPRRPRAETGGDAQAGTAADAVTTHAGAAAHFATARRQLLSSLLHEGGVALQPPVESEIDAHTRARDLFEHLLLVEDDGATDLGRAATRTRAQVARALIDACLSEAQPALATLVYDVCSLGINDGSATKRECSEPDLMRHSMKATRLAVTAAARAGDVSRLRELLQKPVWAAAEEDSDARPNARDRNPSTRVQRGWVGGAIVELVQRRALAAAPVAGSDEALQEQSENGAATGADSVGAIDSFDVLRKRRWRRLAATLQLVDDIESALDDGAAQSKSSANTKTNAHLLQAVPEFELEPRAYVALVAACARESWAASSGCDGFEIDDEGAAMWSQCAFALAKDPLVRASHRQRLAAGAEGRDHIASAVRAVHTILVRQCAMAPARNLDCEHGYSHARSAVQTVCNREQTRLRSVEKSERLGYAAPLNERALRPPRWRAALSQLALVEAQGVTPDEELIASVLHVCAQAANMSKSMHQRLLQAEYATNNYLHERIEAARCASWLWCSRFDHKSDLAPTPLQRTPNDEWSLPDDTPKLAHEAERVAPRRSATFGAVVDALCGGEVAQQLEFQGDHFDRDVNSESVVVDDAWMEANRLGQDWIGGNGTYENELYGAMAFRGTSEWADTGTGTTLATKTEGGTATESFLGQALAISHGLRSVRDRAVTGAVSARSRSSAAAPLLMASAACASSSSGSLAADSATEAFLGLLDQGHKSDDNAQLRQLMACAVRGERISGTKLADLMVDITLSCDEALEQEHAQGDSDDELHFCDSTGKAMLSMSTGMWSNFTRSLMAAAVEANEGHDDDVVDAATRMRAAAFGMILAALAGETVSARGRGRGQGQWQGGAAAAGRAGSLRSAADFTAALDSLAIEQVGNARQRMYADSDDDSPLETEQYVLAAMSAPWSTHPALLRDFASVCASNVTATLEFSGDLTVACRKLQSAAAGTSAVDKALDVIVSVTAHTLDAVVCAITRQSLATNAGEVDAQFTGDINLGTCGDTVSRVSASESNGTRQGQASDCLRHSELALSILEEVRYSGLDELMGGGTFSRLRPTVTLWDDDNEADNRDWHPSHGGRLTPALCSVLGAATHAAASLPSGRATQALVERAFGLYDDATDLVDGTRALGGSQATAALLHACETTGMPQHAIALREELEQPLTDSERTMAGPSATVLPWRTQQGCGGGAPVPY